MARAMCPRVHVTFRRRGCAPGSATSEGGRPHRRHVSSVIRGRSQLHRRAPPGPVLGVMADKGPPCGRRLNTRSLSDGRRTLSSESVPKTSFDRPSKSQLTDAPIACGVLTGKAPKQPATAPKLGQGPKQAQPQGKLRGLERH